MRTNNGNQVAALLTELAQVGTEQEVVDPVPVTTPKVDTDTFL